MNAATTSRWARFIESNSLATDSFPAHSRFFDDGDFFVGQAVDLVDQPVDLAVGGFDLALKERLVACAFGRTAAWSSDA
jgi:hypothetical protein